MNRKDELTAQINRLRTELNTIEAAEDREAARGYLGKCFRYRNACGEHSWWKYFCITGMTPDGSLTTLEFEQDYNGNCSIDQDERFAGAFENSSKYEPITLNEWVVARDQFERTVSNNLRYRYSIPSDSIPKCAQCGAWVCTRHTSIPATIDR